MPFTYLINVPLDQAVRDYPVWLAEGGFQPKTEMVPAAQSAGRVTAHAVYATLCAPHYPACAMDGIAVEAADTFGATETTPITLEPNRFAVVDTGDPLPEGRDAVVMIEDVLWEGEKVVLHEAAAPWQHVRQIGEDVCAGEMLLPAHTPITPAAIGAMIAGGILEVEVFTRPVVGILPTGDEVVPPTDHPQPGDVLEFNSSIFSAMIGEWGGEAKTYPIVKDDPEALTVALTRATDECDLVVLNAGSSAGREDYSAAVIGRVGEVLCHGLAIRPGKPAILGRRGVVPVLGVPGYPVSGILVLEHLLRPLIEGWTGKKAPAREQVEAVLARRAGVVTSFLKADGILDIPQGKEGVEAGEKVTISLLRPREELARTLVMMGSHDPLLDEVADLLHQTHPDLYMNSTHVGSMGGIMALRRGEAHGAGCHLLDESDGSYNTSYLEKYFPNGGVYQVECVGRTQGLMVAKGNPLGLKGFGDIAKPGLRYVDRQKGSGTRILADYLCRKEGVDPATVYGYDREELTHTSVAAQIASGTADAGMGILSAARLYDLDFLPVCVEQYDLLIPDYAWGTPAVEALLEVLKSPAFRERMEKLGGYTIHQPGRVRRHF